MPRSILSTFQDRVDVLGNPFHTNVVFMQRGPCQQYYAKWIDPDKGKRSKSFAISKFGAIGAYILACQLAKDRQQATRLVRFERVYHDNGDGTTTMNLKYKDLPVSFIVDTESVERLKTLTWSVGNKGQALSTSPTWVFMHRFIMNAQESENVYHINRNITDCRKSNLQVSIHPRTDYLTIGSVNVLMSEQCRKRKIRRRAILKQLKISCVECAFSDSRALQFDHIVRAEKSFNISNCGSVAKIKEEIKKCQVLCAFCHTLKTRQEIVPRDKTLRTKRIHFTGIVNKMKREDLKACEHCSRVVVAGQEQAFHLDHIDPLNKVADVSALANHGLCLDELLAEVAKTRLLCANCHAIRTYDQHQSGEISDLKRTRLAAKLAQDVALF